MKRKIFLTAVFFVVVIIGLGFLRSNKNNFYSERVEAETSSHLGCYPECNKTHLELPVLIGKDSEGNFFVADAVGFIVKLDSSFNEIARFDGSWNGYGSFGSGQIASMLVDPITDNIYIATVRGVGGTDDRIEVIDNNGNFLRVFGQGSLTDVQDMDIYNSELYVYNSDVGIWKFDSVSGMIQGLLGTIGTGVGEFNGGNNSRMELDGSGNIFLTNDFNGNTKVLKLDSSGSYVGEWGTVQGTGQGEFFSPSGISVDDDGNVYVGETALDNETFRIQKFDNDGNFVDWFVPYGRFDGQTRSSGVVEIIDQKLYVLDSIWDSFEVFDLDGSYIERLGPVAGPEEDDFTGALGITIDSEGNIYTAEENFHNRIKKHNADFELQTQIGGYGSIGDEMFSGVGDVAVDSNGKIFAADWYGDRVKVFDSSGNYLYEFGSTGTGNGQFDGAVSGIAIDSNDNVYVADTWNSRVQKFANDGTYLSTIGEYGTGDGQFDTVSDVAIDSEGNIYVTDDYNYRIQKFDSEGNFLLSWGEYGSEDGQFDCDAEFTEIAIDVGDNIYVTDCYNARIQVFDSEGNFLYKWGESGYQADEFFFPTSIAVSPSGRAYVSDWGIGHVQVYELKAFVGDAADSLSIQNLSGENLKAGAVGDFGIDKTIRVRNNGLVLADVVTDITADRSWASVTGESDGVNGKAVVSGLTDAEGTEVVHTLYIPIPSDKNSDSFVLCPQASTIEEVTTSCEDATIFEHNQTKSVEGDLVTSSKVTIGSQVYWRASGVSGTGGLIVESIPEQETTEDQSEDISATESEDSIENVDLEIIETTEEYGYPEVEVCWETNIDAKGKLEYGIYIPGETKYTETVNLEEYTRSHCVNIEAFDPLVNEYFYRITAESRSGQKAILEKLLSFPDQEDTSVADIDQGSQAYIAVKDVNTENEHQIVLTYMTNQQANCLVYYGYLEDELVKMYADNIKGINHEAILDIYDLPEGADVFYRIMCVFDGEREVEKTGFVAKATLENQRILGSGGLSIQRIFQVALSIVALLVPGMFLLLYPGSILYAFLWFRNRKKHRVWGIIYDKKSGKPVPFAIVKLKHNSNILVQTVADMDGKYMLPSSEGLYELEVAQYGYNTYKEVLNLSGEKAFGKDIGIEGVGKYSFVFEIKKILPKVNAIVFSMALPIALIITLLSPNVVNFFILGLYLVQIVTWFLFRSPRGMGTVYDSKLSSPLANLIVRVYSADTLKLVNTQMTNEKGKYGFLLEDGNYELTISSEKYEIDKSKLSTMMKTRTVEGRVHLFAKVEKGRYIDIKIPVKKIS